MRLFKKGDRVRLRTDYYAKKGWYGFVLRDQNCIWPSVPVQFDKETRGHSCGCIGVEGKCWYILDSVLDLLEEEDDDLYI